MRLASVWVEGQPRLAAESSSGLVDLSAADPALGQDVGGLLASGPEALDRARAAMERARPLPGPARYRPVVPRPPKFWCLGLNDTKHAAEAGLEIGPHLVAFLRTSSSLIGHLEPMLRPVESKLLDYEGELAVVLGRGGRRIDESDALAHVAGYTVFNDGTLRDFQLRTSQWTLGKNFDGTGALGPVLVTPEELPRAATGLRLTTHVDGELRQDGDTAALCYGVAQTLALLSQVATFEPGDVVALGTPAGIGHAMRPPRYLEPGQVVRVEIDGIGALENPVVDDG